MLQKTDALNRKKKGIKQSVGKQLALNDRRLALLSVFQDFYYADTFWSHALMQDPYTETYHKQELQWLANEEQTEHGTAYLKECDEQKKNWKYHSTPFTYRLTPQGRKLFESDPTYIITSEKGSFPHAKMIVEYMQSLVLGQRERDDLRIISPKEILKNHDLGIKVDVTFNFGSTTSSHSYNLKPDNLFILEFTVDGQKLRSCIVLEAENTLTTFPKESQTLKDPSIFRKYLAYDHIMQNKLYRQWGFTNMRVVFLAPNETKLQTMIEALKVANPRYKNAFLFRTQSVFGDRETTPRPHANHLTGAYCTLNGLSTLLP